MEKMTAREQRFQALFTTHHDAVLRFAREAQMAVEERPFTVEEARAADEAFVTSASAFVLPVVEIDGAPVGNGRPGPVATRLREIYIEESRRAAI